MTKSRPQVRSFAARAIAEIAVIIFGVTIALWADGRVAARNDREVEAARLRALSEDIDRTLIALREEVEDADSAVSALRALVSRARASWTPADAQATLLSGLFYVPMFRAEQGVYDDLKNSGELSLLRDAALRRALSALDRQLQQLRLQQEDVAMVQQLNLDRYLIQNVDLYPVLGTFLGVHGDTRPELTDLTFLNDAEFRNLAIFKLDLVVGFKAALDEVDEAVRAVQALVVAHLDSPT